MVNSLSPRIIALQNESREPISVYINSDGGSVPEMETLLRLLRASNQDFVKPCNIITIVTSRAASAAADLLSYGDYAIAFPESSVMYHGGRILQDTPLTVQLTSTLNQLLRLSNDVYAMKLVRGNEFRFFFRCLSSKGIENTFEEIRKKKGSKEMTDLDCFLDFISNRISHKAMEIVRTARNRYQRYNTLLSYVMKKMKKIPNKRLVQIEGDYIKALVNFEVDRNKGQETWTFKEGGLIQLNDDFFLFNEYIESIRQERVKQLCTQYCRFFLNEADAKAIEEADETTRDKLMIEKVQPQLQPLWAFFVALCHALQEGENDLTATDAFWLGLIDEVMGVKELPSFRLIMEYKADEPKQLETQS
jgi:ATP-dependent protease ClpP protease subunit